MAGISGEIRGCLENSILRFGHLPGTMRFAKLTSLAHPFRGRYGRGPVTTERSATPRRRQRRITWATTAALGGLAVASLTLVSGWAGPARPTVVAATQSEDVSTLADADHNDDVSGNLCPAGDLRASAAPGGVRSGITTTVVTLVNTGTTSCGLRGHAQLIGLSASGEHMALDAPTTGTPGTHRPTCWVLAPPSRWSSEPAAPT